MQVDQPYSYEADFGDVQMQLELIDTDSSEEDTNSDPIIFQSLLEVTDTESSEEDTCLNSVIKKCDKMRLKIKHNECSGTLIGWFIGCVVTIIGIPIVIRNVETLTTRIALIGCDVVVVPLLGAIAGGGIQRRYGRSWGDID